MSCGCGGSGGSPKPPDSSFMSGPGPFPRHNGLQDVGNQCGQSQAASCCCTPSTSCKTNPNEPQCLKVDTKHVKNITSKELLVKHEQRLINDYEKYDKKKKKCGL